MLLAAYLVILQLKPANPLSLIFKSHSDIDGLLDMVEYILQRVPLGSQMTETGLMVMRTERENFEVTSPSVSHSARSHDTHGPSPPT